MNIKDNLDEEEIQIILNIIDSVSVQGTESMKKLLAISEKLKKAAKKSVSKGTDAKPKG